ncbi:MAG TPA: amidohydrolase family protein [Vicinamibacterales bacterium]
MRRILTGVLAIALAVAVMSPGSSAQILTTNRILFEGARLVVGDGSAPIENSAFTIENGQFTRVGKKGELTPSPGMVRVDLTGKTVIPALLDAHAHVGYTKGLTDLQENYTRENFTDILRRYAYSGVAAVESLGSDRGDLPYQIQNGPPISDAALYVTTGRGLAPPMQGPGPAVLKPAPYGVTNEAEARKDVQELAATKVRIIKIWVDDRNGTVTKLSPELSRAIIDEAHKRNLLVVAHASKLDDLKDLVRAGLDGSAHIGLVANVDDELVTLLKARPQFFFTGLVGGSYRGVEPGRPAWFDDPLLRAVVPGAQLKRLGDSMAARAPDAVTRTRERFEQLKGIVAKLRSANVRIALGTDAGPGDQFFGWGVHYELETMVALGMTPMQAIVSGTQTSADVMGLKQLGTVAAGKSADFIVLDANPLDSIVNSRKIGKVYVRGSEVNRAKLGAAWARER